MFLGYEPSVSLRHFPNRVVFGMFRSNLIALFLLTCPFAYAHGSLSVVIDDFSVGNSGTVPAVFSSKGLYPVFTTTDPSILGGVRKWQVDVTHHSVTDSKIYDGIADMFGIANGMGQHSNVAIRWDGQNNQSMSGNFPTIDISQNGSVDSFSLEILSADLATRFEMSVSDIDSSFKLSKAFSGTANTAYRFSEFLGIDFAQIKSIQLNISGLSAFDVAMGQLSTTKTVPEPIGLLIWSTFFGIGLLRLRQRRL